ncbi:hypothetical protein F0562_027735 [Nyssa sinensis]|uniref:Pterin-binding domain-containing protein n=1 Tax=Nyssa sinensis TaxID=561372 RepID=A0A5J5B8Q7_9ASTE|nr:hypothetical protein F0562_027735 [Nyssa sinensis]
MAELQAMASTRLIVPYSSNRLHIRPFCKVQNSIFSPISYSAISKHRDGSRLLTGQSLQYLSTQTPQSDRNTKMDLIVCSSVQPGAPLPSGGSPSNSWRGWMLGMLITIILPFMKHKWGPLFQLTKRVENAVEAAEFVVETIENVAKKVEEVAEDIADEIPAGGKLKEAIDFVEQVAEGTAKAAHLVDGVIDKFQEVEEKVESMMEPVKDEANEVAKEATEGKQTSNVN